MNYLVSRISMIKFYFVNIITLIFSAFLNVSDYNIITIEWYEAAKHSYWKSIRSVPFVSKRVAFLIDFLENNADLDPYKTMIIGFSMGAHIAGLSARFATSEIGEIVGKSSEKLSIL